MSNNAEDDTSVSRISVDAMPLDPRPQQKEERTSEQVPDVRDQLQRDQQNQQQTYSKRVDSPNNEHTAGLEDKLNIPKPPSDWQYNSFLVDLADKITDTELEKIKPMFRGEEMGEGILSSIRTPSEFFKILGQRMFLSSDNLLYLQAILLKLKRPELIQMAIDYARTMGNVLYFSPASREPLNGYRYVKFHVEGKDFRNCTRGYVNELRHLVATLLFIPMEYVVIAGIEPSSSMLITLMIPDMYVELLENMLKTNNHIEEFANIGIDTVVIGGKVYNIHGIAEAELVKSEQQEKLENVYEQLQNKKKQLEAREIECLQVTRELDILKQKLNFLKRLFYNVPMQDGSAANKPASLASQSALTDFTHALRVVTELKYDRKVIQRLLDANTTIIIFRVKEGYATQQLQFAVTVQNLQAQIIPMLLMIEQLKFYIDVESKGGIECVLQESFQGLVNVMQTSVVQLTEHAVSILQSISNDLRDKDRKRLEKKYEWDPKDRLTLTKNADKSKLLECIYHKEVIKTRQAVNFDAFIAKCLQDVGRKDLVLKFTEIRKQQEELLNRTNTQQYPEQNVQLKAMAQKLDTVGRQMNAIHSMMTTTRNSFAQNYDPLKDPFVPFTQKPNAYSSAAFP